MEILSNPANVVAVQKALEQNANWVNSLTGEHNSGVMGTLIREYNLPILHHSANPHSPISMLAGIRSFFPTKSPTLATSVPTNQRSPISQPTRENNSLFMSAGHQVRERHNFLAVPSRECSSYSSAKSEHALLSPEKVGHNFLQPQPRKHNSLPLLRRERNSSPLLSRELSSSSQLPREHNFSSQQLRDHDFVPQQPREQNFLPSPSRRHNCLSTLTDAHSFSLSPARENKSISFPTKNPLRVPQHPCLTEYSSLFQQPNKQDSGHELQAVLRQHPELIRSYTNNNSTDLTSSIMSRTSSNQGKQVIVSAS